MSQVDRDILFATAFYNFVETLYTQSYAPVVIERKERHECTYPLGDELEKHVPKLFQVIIRFRDENGILARVDDQPVVDENTFRKFIKRKIFDISDEQNLWWEFMYLCCQIAAVSVECELRGVNNTSELSIELIADVIKFYNCINPFRSLGFWHGMNIEAYVRNYGLKMKLN